MPYFAFEFICIENIGSADYKMENTNIIENTQTGSRYGIIDVDNNAKLTMIHCSVYGNSPVSQVFYITSGSITCDNCSIGSDQKGSFSTINTASESFINYYEYLELDNISFKIFIVVNE